MRIGGYKIKGVSRRFVFIAAAVLLLLGFSFYVLTREEPVVDPIRTPAFPKDKLPEISGKQGWIDPYISTYGLRQPQNKNAFADGTQYRRNIGLPFRFKAYVPLKESIDQTAIERPSLMPRLERWQFLPAVFVDPTSTQSTTELEDVAGEELAAGQPIVLGFPEGQIPVGGQGYEITGLLYWNTKNLKPPTEAEIEAEYPNSPVILVASYRPLAAPELEAPTTHRADLNIAYREGDLQIDVVRVDWSAGNEVRACIRMLNNGFRTIDLFDPAEIKVDIGDGGGFYDGLAEPGSAFETIGSISAGQQLSGYISFPEAQPSSEPSGDAAVILRLPSLLAGTSRIPEGQESKVVVSGEQFRDVYKVSMDKGTDSSEGCANAQAQPGAEAEA